MLESEFCQADGMTPEGSGRWAGRVLRVRSGEHAVTNTELFFDLVYVFAVTQLARHLVEHPSVDGAWQTLILFGAVWLAWVYTTWVTNWLDPDRLAVRLLLLALMLVGLLLSVALPGAFAGRAGLAAGAFCVSQVGRSAFVVVALGNERLGRNFQRILAWSVASSLLWVLGVFFAGQARAGLWAAAVIVDLIGGWVGFATPGLGRSRTSDWTISGDHFAERCQGFVLIALGESIVDIGVTLSDFNRIGASDATAFASVFVTSAALWWIYFDRSAAEGARRIARSADPGRLGRSAYHLVHPVMVAGIVVVAGADERVLADPSRAVDGVTAWMVLGGPALFLAGHAAFRRVVWGGWPLSPVLGLVGVGVVGVGLAGVVAAPVDGVVLDLAAAVVVVAVAAGQRVPVTPVGEAPEGDAPPAGGGAGPGSSGVPERDAPPPPVNGGGGSGGGAPVGHETGPATERARGNSRGAPEQPGQQ
jgi:low temperature requirement protein LtrA